MSASGLLVLARHGESTFNAQNLFTGWRDPDLTPRGITEAVSAGVALREEDLRFDLAFTSVLIRAQHSLRLMLEALGQAELETHVDAALNERDYGELSGLNKDEARARCGGYQVHLWRRSYDVAPPGGESLRMTAARTLPYFERAIVPALVQGRTVLVVAHGNSLRSIVMRLDRLDAGRIVDVHLATGLSLLYRVGADGRVLDKREIAAVVP